MQGHMFIVYNIEKKLQLTYNKFLLNEYASIFINKNTYNYNFVTLHTGPYNYILIQINDKFVNY